MNYGPPEARSWHEAGHAVIARILGGNVRWLTIEHDEEVLDGAASIEWRGMQRRTMLAASACVAFGGPLAELAFEDRDVLTLEELQAWAADWEEVVAAARELGANESERQTLIRQWFEVTSAYFEDPEVVECVARVADALDAHGTLDDVLFEDAIS